MSDTVKDMDNLLIKKRGYVSKMPENKRAVMIVSGGLDSIITSARLIEDYDLELFPLHVDRGQRNRLAEQASVDYYDEYMSKRYGEGKYHKTVTINVNVPPVEFKNDLTTYMATKGHPARDSIMLLLGVEYAVAVSEKTGIPVKTVFSANVFDDPFPHCTLDSLRADTINACVNLGDWGWLLTSPNADPYLTESQFGKVEEIKWADEHSFPMEKTASCYEISKDGSAVACGECKACVRRKEAFKLAGVTDLTNYQK